MESFFNPLPYTAVDIAKAFLERAQKDHEAKQDISNMKLNKLVYFAQIVCLAIFGRAIHGNNTHAWDYGPVAPSLYKKIKQFGSRPISLADPEVAQIFKDASKVEAVEAVKSIDIVWGALKGKTAVQLSMMTHRPGTPWEITYEKNQYGVIPLALMKEKKFGD